MKQPFFGSIKYTVILIALLAVLPAFIVILYSGFSMRTSEEGKFEKRLMEKAEFLATQEALKLENTRVLLMALSQVNSIKQQDKESSRNILRDIAAKNANLHTIYLLDKNANIIASGQDEEELPLPEELRQAKETLRNGTFSLGGFVSHTSADITCLVCTLPVVHEKQFNGVLLATLPIAAEWNYEKTENYGAHRLLLDKNGNPAYGSGAIPPVVLDTLRLRQKNNPTTADSGLETIPETDESTKSLLAYRLLRLSNFDPAYLALGIVIGQKEISSGINAKLMRDLSFLGLLFLGLVLVGVATCHLALFRPINRLLDVARFMGAGKMRESLELNRQMQGRITGELGELSNAFENLGTSLLLRGSQLEEARQEAEKAGKAKSEFLANMSHEIRTPMNAILGMAYLSSKADLAPKPANYISKIYSAANSLLAIVNDILDFSKIEAGKLYIDVTEFDLHHVIAKLRAAHAPQAEEKGVEFVCTLSPSAPRYLMGDPLRLAQALGNLIHNAVKFTSRGEVNLRCTALPVSDARVSVRFEIKDNGPGMDQETLHRFFMDQRPDVSSPVSVDGGKTGLGIAISRRLLGMMSGTLEVSSLEGRGTSVTVDIPFDLPEHFRAEDENSLGQAMQAFRAMVVDDERESGLTLQGMLASLQIEAERFQSAPAAIMELARAQDAGRPYNIIFMDWKMPEMDGLEATRQIRSMPLLKIKPVIVLVTGFARADILPKLKQDDIDGFLPKPITPSLLYYTLQESLVSLEERNPSAWRRMADEKNRECAENGLPCEERDEANLEDVMRAVQGMRFLLVEDNDINQAVAVEVLHDAGAEAETAETAEQGLELLRSALAGTSARPYDAVLMDIQLPGMDGYEATRLIRLDPVLRSTVVIAMTADSGPDTARSCKDAGMDDQVAKPLEVNAFYAVLAKWRGKKHQDDTEAGPACGTSQAGKFA